MHSFLSSKYTVSYFLYFTFISQLPDKETDMYRQIKRKPYTNPPLRTSHNLMYISLFRSQSSFNSNFHRTRSKSLNQLSLTLVYSSTKEDILDFYLGSPNKAHFNIPKSQLNLSQQPNRALNII